jgi:hypothetical protein
MWLLEVEDDVLAVLKPAQTWANRIASSTDGRVIRQKLKTILEALPVPDRLGWSPGLHGIANDRLEVGFRKPC